MTIKLVSQPDPSQGALIAYRDPRSKDGQLFVKIRAKCHGQISRFEQKMESSFSGLLRILRDEDSSIHDRYSTLLKFLSSFELRDQLSNRLYEITDVEEFIDEVIAYNGFKQTLEAFEEAYHEIYQYQIRAVD